MKPPGNEVEENGESLNTALTANKLSQFQKALMVQRIGEYWENNQINDWLESEYGLTLTAATLTYYRYSENYTDAIQRARATYNASLEDTAGASSHWRIEQLMKLLRIASKDITSPARRRECQSIIEQLATECPGMAAIAATSTIQIGISSELAAGFGGVKQETSESL